MASGRETTTLNKTPTIMRNRYWSSSKLGLWILPRPEAASSEEWRAWEKNAKENTPIRYFIVEEFFDFVQNVVNYIPDKINNVRYYIKNRYSTKTHTLTSNLQKGLYHELDERILHSMFDELVNFIKHEKGWMELISHRDKYPNKKVTIEMGLEYLRWESTLTKDYLDSDDPDYNTKTEQAIVADWIIEAYHWWTVERPSRPDPMEESGWSEYCDTHDYLFNDDRNTIRPMLDRMDQLEMQYYDEDTEMLIQLIKYRNRLWT